MTQSKRTQLLRSAGLICAGLVICLVAFVLEGCGGGLYVRYCQLDGAGKGWCSYRKAALAYKEMVGRRCISPEGVEILLGDCKTGLGWNDGVEICTMMNEEPVLQCESGSLNTGLTNNFICLTEHHLTRLKRQCGGN